MNKKQLFEKYHIDETHNVWEGIDSWMSVEIYRLMHNGELPPENDKSVKWVTEFLDRIGTDLKWWVKIINEREDWGSLFLTAKRMVYKLSEQILKVD